MCAADASRPDVFKVVRETTIADLTESIRILNNKKEC